VRHTRDDPVRSLDWGEPVSVGGELNLRDVAVVLTNEGVGAAIVRHEDGLGVVSERDLVGALAGNGDADELWSSDVMSPQLVTIPAGATVLQAARRMLDADVRHLVVVDDDDDVVTVISMRDLFAVLVDETPP
jgi:CBS domain-containing protein